MATSTCLSRRNCGAKKLKKATAIAKSNSCHLERSREIPRSWLKGNAAGFLDPARNDVLEIAQQLEAKTRIEFAAVIRAATCETRDCAVDFAYAREITPAIRAAINEMRR